MLFRVRLPSANFAPTALTERPSQLFPPRPATFPAILQMAERLSAAAKKVVPMMLPSKPNSQALIKKQYPISNQSKKSPQEDFLTLSSEFFSTTLVIVICWEFSFSMKIKTNFF